MAPDPRHCFACDRRLDSPPPTDDRRFRRCPSCQADLDAYLAALGDLETVPPPRFRGVIALGVPLPGWPTDITMIALEIWDRFSELSFVEVPGPNPPRPHPRALHHSPLGDQPPNKWTITSDLDTVHHGGGGSGGTPGTDRLLAWESTVAPSLPTQARRLDVRAQAPGADARTTIDLSSRPITRRPAAIEHQGTPADADPNCPSCGPPPEPATSATLERPPDLELNWARPAPPEPDRNAWSVTDDRPLCATCRSSVNTVFAAKAPTNPLPDRVIALGAELGPIFGSQLVIPAVTTWPTWFDIDIVGNNSGAWSELLGATRRAHRWEAHDNRGRHYLGASTGGGSGLDLARKSLSFTPTLAPDATTLTVTFPASIDGQAIRAIIDLQ